MTTIFGRGGSENLTKIGFKSSKIASYYCASFELIREIKEYFSEIVISTGGGLPEISNSFKLMKKNGLIIWINSSPKEIEKRLDSSNRGHRPLLFNNDLDLIENLEEQLKKRYDVYSKADLIIKNDNINEIECSELILKKLSDYE